MELSKKQISDFKDLGYTFIQNVFSPEEVRIMQSELPNIYSQRRDEIVYEKDGKTVRTAFAVHRWNKIFKLLSQHPRLVNPIKQLLGGNYYIHQWKLNKKAAFDGDVWQWHQDYGTWKNEDGMPEGMALNVGIFLDDVNEFNGALNFIPKSHRDGYLRSDQDTTTTSYPLWTLDDNTIKQLVERGGIVSPKGSGGSVVFFDCNLVHGSLPNMSPWDRTIVYVSANHVNNRIRFFKRPEYIAERDFEPVTTLSDDCLFIEKHGK